MILTVGYHNKTGTKSPGAKIWMIMKLTIVLLLFFTFKVNAKAYAQKITIVKKNVRLAEVFKSIENQTGYLFFYDKAPVQKTDPIDIAITNATLEQALSACLKDQKLIYTIVNNTIVIQPGKIAVSEIQNVVMPMTPHPPPVEIRGRVVNKNGDPLENISVLITGTKTGTTTDNNGRFTLTATDNKNIVLEISSVGFQTKKVKLEKLTDINVMLEEEVSGLADVVVVGYGTQKRKDLTGAVGQIASAELKDLSVVRLDQAIQGKVAGVQVKLSDGAPGAAPKILIRGIGSISAGSNALYVVDGFPIDDIQMINPNDIESIDILKDASATAIYGSRGSNGVIIITTKRGKEGKTMLNFDSQFGWQKIQKEPQFMNAKDQAEYGLEGMRNRNMDAGNSVAGYPTTWVFPVPKPEMDVIEGRNKIDINMMDYVFRTAPQNKQQLSVSGGSKNIKYALSGEYLDQQGIIINTNFKRYSMRANIDAQLSKKIALRVNFNPYFTNTNSTIANGAGGGQGEDVLGQASAWVPWYPAYDSAGGYFVIPFAEGQTGWNPIAVAKEIITNQKNNGFLANVNTEYSILNNLKLNVLLGVNIQNTERMKFVPALYAFVNNTAYGQNGSSLHYNWLTEYTLNYNKSFGLHQVTALAGFTAQKDYLKTSSLESNKYPNNLVPTLSAVSGLISTGTSSIDEWSLFSYLARINYNYNSKYYLTGSIRRDGSSRFGSENKYGLFPSVAVAWRVSNEKFMKEVGFISDLKLRASYGKTGNNNIGNYASYANIRYSTYPFGNITQGGYVQGAIANSALTWETQSEINAGVDVSFLGGKLLVTVDHFQSRNNDLLLNVNIPMTTGFSTTLKNIGEVRNKGWELLVSSRNVTGVFNWTTDFNISSFKNEVVRLGPKGDPIYSGGNITMIGQPIGMFYGWVTDGIFMNKKQLDMGPIYGAGTVNVSHVGDVRFKDVSGPNGTPDGIINSFDQTIMGNPYPDFYYGMTNHFSYKNIGLTVGIQGAQGNDILSLGRIAGANGRGTRRTQLTLMKNWWKSEAEPGDGNANNMRPNDAATGNNRGQYNDRYIDNGSYLKISNISLSYAFADNVARRFSLSSLRAYITATNPFLFTRMTGFNPEVEHSAGTLAPGNDQNDYPVPKSLMIGINVGF